MTMIGRRACGTCTVLHEQVEDLRRRLDAAEAEKGKLTDRLVALADPRALALARVGERPGAAASPSFAYEPEGQQHTMMVDGTEQPIRMVNGKAFVMIGGILVPVDDYQRGLDWLTNGGEGPSPFRDQELPPLDGVGTPKDGKPHG